MTLELHWPVESWDFGLSVRKALSGSGGLEMARAIEVKPALRRTAAYAPLAELGCGDLDAYAGLEQTAAAALGVQAAGAVLWPWPLIQQLLVPQHLRPEFRALYVTAGPVRRLAHLDVAGPALTLDLRSGLLQHIEPAAGVTRTAIDPFGVPCRSGGPVTKDVRSAVGLDMILRAFWTLGALETARSRVVDHSQDRLQFGKPISSFGGVQWHLSEIEVAVESVRELAAQCLYLFSNRQLAQADALALQLTTLDCATSVLTHAHQVMAATGLCEEHDLTFVDRHLQPALRRPMSAAETAAMLTAAIAEEGFDGIYPVEPAASVLAAGEVRSDPEQVG